MNTLQLILVVIFPAIVLAFINQNSATCCKLSTFSPPKRICPTIDYGFDRNSYYTHIVLNSQAEDKSDVVQGTEPSAFDRVASTGLAGVLAIAAAESIFWALGMPLAELWVYFTTGELIDLTTQEGQLQAAGFTFGYGGFATVILQYRVTLFAIPLVPIMEKFVVEPGKKVFGEKFGSKKA